ncbi:MAG: GNAT family N-acetyltransferase [Candidatus Thorarchaeota archaeon]|nr:GNAT family N-acetyltransferase [Candidatus Thorarchaeota archaeon]
MTATEVRPLKSDDIPQLMEIDKEIFPDDPLEEDWLKKRMERDGCFVLCQNEQILGNLIVAPYGKDEGHLGRIGVAKNEQGKGYGSILMEYAIDWFRSKGNIKSVHLYTQDFNETAQNLYKKFGFERSGTTWHYFVPYETLRAKKQLTVQTIKDDEIDSVGERYASLPPEQIRKLLTYEEFLVLTLKDRIGNVVGVCRFTPSFPGCFPFEITRVEYFDDFIDGVVRFGLPEYDYVRVTFTDIPELAQLCDDRRYRLHHRLLKMTLLLQLKQS